MRPVAGILATALVTSSARADDVKPIYVGAQASIQAGAAIFMNRAIPNVGIRLMTGPSLDFAFTSEGFFAISMNASIGPVIRF